MQADLERELAETEAELVAAKVKVNGDDHEMDGVEAKDEEEGSEAGSEDLEAESDDDDEEDEDEGEADGDEEMEVDESERKSTAETNGEKGTNGKMEAQQPEVMVH